MSIKGFPSQQKRIQGQSAKAEFVTVQPTADYKNALDVHARFAFRIDSSSVPRVAQSGTGNLSDGYGTYIQDTLTPAKVGDFVRFIDGNMAFLEIPIVEVNTNGFRLAARVESAFAPGAGDSFYIMRLATQLVDSDGRQLVTLTSSIVGTVIDKAIIDLSSVNVLDSAYTQLIAATAATATQFEIINSSGVPMILAFGAAASEVDKLYIAGDGLQRQELAIPINTRLSIKSVKGTVDTGFIAINTFAE